MAPISMVKQFLEAAIKHADDATKKVDTWAQENVTKLGEDAVDSLEAKAESVAGDAESLSTAIDDGASLPELLRPAGELMTETAELLTEAAAAAEAAGIEFA